MIFDPIGSAGPYRILFCLLMTKEQKDKAIAERKLPRDFLDRPWPIFWGFAPVVMCIVLAIGGLAGIYANRRIVPLLIVLFLLYCVIQLGVTIYFRLTERKLKCLTTDLSKEENEQVVSDAARALGWKIKMEENYIAITKPFAFGQNCYLIKVLTEDRCIYYNLRTKGTYRGRNMHTFGFETFRELQFLKKLQQYAYSKLTIK